MMHTGHGSEDHTESLHVADYSGQYVCAASWERAFLFLHLDERGLLSPKAEEQLTYGYGPR